MLYSIESSTCLPLYRVSSLTSSTVWIRMTTFSSLTTHSLEDHLTPGPGITTTRWIRWDERVDKVVNDYDTYADTMDFLKVVAAMI